MTEEESLITDNYQLELKLKAKTEECDKFKNERDILIAALNKIRELEKDL